MILAVAEALNPINQTISHGNLREIDTGPCPIHTVWLRSSAFML